MPLCWPAADSALRYPPGRCGCGRGHQEKDIGKAPLLGAGYQTTRADAAQVRAWWRRWPSANVGLLLEPAGLLVADLDGRPAVAEADALGCPATHTVRRGDRLHLYYARPAGVPGARRTRRGACRAIDVLAAGYVVAAGSLHASGDRYTVARDLPVAAAPDWLAAWLRGDATPGAEPVAPAGDTAAALAEAMRLLAGHRLLCVLESGTGGDPRYPSRSEGLCALEGALLDRGMEPGAVAAALLGVPWAAGMRAHPERWLPADVARLAARRLRPATPEEALPAYRALPADVRRALGAHHPKRRAAGAVAAVRAGCPPRAVAAVLVAAGVERADAVALARWAGGVGHAPG